jgi:hypothetical protein
MVSAVRQLTSVGGDVRQIARLLQKKAPPGHMLAYINQEEADLLKARGGSGRPHADTGVPSFEEDLVPLDVAPEPAAAVQAGPDVSGQSIQTPRPAASDYGGYDVAATPTEVVTPSFGAGTEVAPTFQTPREIGNVPGGSALPTPPSLTPAQLQPKGDLDLLGKVKSLTGLGDESLKRLGIGGLQALIGGYQANKASQAGQAGKEEMMAMAAPYRQQGSDIIAKSQRGELTPVGQQQLQAVQAQAAQGAEKRGGVGAQQSMAQVEAFRQQLLQQQYDYGLKLSGIADNIAMGAIKTGLQADQYVNTLTNNYFNNMTRTLYGSAPQVAGVPVGTPGAA